MKRLFNFLFLILSYFVFGIFGVCREACIPESSGRKFTCMDRYKPPGLPYQIDRPGTCTVSENRQGRNTLCCENQDAYIKYTLKADEDSIAKIAIGALEGEFPHQVFLNMRRENSIGSCGGTIYNKNYIITAAHCVTDLESGVVDHPDNVTVSAGVTNVQNIQKENMYRVSEVIVHNLYDNDRISRGYDIAILRLRKSLDYTNPKIRPLKIAPSNFEIDYQSKGIFIGWGRRNHSGVERTTPDLHKSFVPIRTRNQCQEINAERGSFYNPIEQHLCIAGGNSGVTVGQGDSGGPTICPDVNDGNRPVLCGIASYKQCKTCNQSPSVYIRVSSFASWIDKMTNRVGQEPAFFPDVNLEGVKGEPEDFLVRILGRNKHCDGTLVASKVVVTSASCIFDNGDISDIVVTHTKTKRYLRLSGMRTIPSTYTNKSGNVESDQLLKDTVRDHDLAILQLRSPLDIDFFPAIPRSNYRPRDAVELSFSSSRDQRERRNYNVLEKANCQNSYDILNVNLTSRQLCAVEKYSGGSTCDRPLGSPLICDERYLCGIASTRGCFFAFPNIFTNTMHYSSILTENIEMLSE